MLKEIFVITKENLIINGYLHNIYMGLRTIWTHCANCNKYTHQVPYSKSLADYKYVCNECGCHSYIKH